MFRPDRIPHSLSFLSVAIQSCIGNGLDRPASIPLLSEHSKFAFEKAARSNAPIGFCQAAKIYNETCKIESYGHCGNKYEGLVWKVLARTMYSFGSEVAAPGDGK